MTDEHLDYFRKRERQERAAAKNARSLDVRRVHQQAAEYYAAVVQGTNWSDPVPFLRSSGAL